MKSRRSLEATRFRIGIVRQRYETLDRSPFVFGLGIIVRFGTAIEMRSEGSLDRTISFLAFLFGHGLVIGIGE